MDNSGIKPAKILIVDDHPLIREGLAARISTQSDMEVCGEASGIDDTLAQLRAKNPDLVVVDLALKGGHGLDLIKQIKARDERMKMLVVSAYEESLFAERALQAGARGYINKQEVQQKVIEAIRTVLHGQCYISAEMTQRLVGQAIGGSKHKPRGVESLSDRELEVFQLIGLGKASSAIAQQLHLSVHTIDSHREKIRAKLNLKNSAELMQRAVQWVLESA